MENIDKLPFKDPPSTDTSLTQLCCRRVAKSFHRYNYDTIMGLPGPVLSALIRYLTPYHLYRITEILLQKGIDADFLWKEHISDTLRHKRWLLNSETSYIDEEDVHHFIVCHRTCPFHQKYISFHCGTLLKRFLATREVDESTRLYTSLLQFLPSAVYIKITVQHFIRLVEWHNILDILLNNLLTLILTNIEDILFSLTFSVDTMVLLLHKFCCNRTLKAIVFQSNSLGCTFGKDFGFRLNAVYRAIGTSSQRKAKENTSYHAYIENSVENENIDENSDRHLFDDALTFHEVHVTEVPVFSEILKTIDLSRNILMDNLHETTEESSSVISLSFRHPEYFAGIAQYLPKWNSLQRLNLEGDDFDSAPPSDLIEEILLRVGCHRFTHLRLADMKVDIVPHLFYILCEYYRKDALKVQPMELLSLVHTKESQGSIGNCHKAAIIDHDLRLEQFQKFENQICAVKDLCLSRINLDQLGFTAVRTVLRLNTCLTNIRLVYIDWNSTCTNDSVLEQWPDLWISVFESLMENKVLKSFSVSMCKLLTKSSVEALSRTLVDFLNNVKTLNTLKLVDCCIPGELVMKRDLIEVIQNHPSLTVLSLSSNQLGPSGAQFLSSLLVTNRCKRLQELDLSSCNIHGRDLLTAAKSLSKPAMTQPGLRKLNISGMILDEHIPGGRLHTEIRSQFQYLTHILIADYHGHSMADHIANM